MFGANQIQLGFGHRSQVAGDDDILSPGGSLHPGSIQAIESPGLHEILKPRTLDRT